MKRILIIDDDMTILSGTTQIVETMDYEIVTASTSAEGIDLVKNENFDLVISDLMLPELDDGLSVINAVKDQVTPPAILIMSAYGTTDNIVIAMREGADDFINKGFTVDELQIKIERLLRAYQHEKNHEIEKRLFDEHLQRTFGDYQIIGKSRKIKQLLELINKVTTYGNTTCLIEGETGTGKELVARAIHRQGSRHNKPFVDINCASIPQDLMENELFGHVKGAYTGAASNQQGKFEWASGGILFLDEVSEMDLKAQAKLLRVIEQGSFCRLGSNLTIKTDVMIIAATNKILANLVNDDKFREDLYYRLNVVKISTPPLRENLDDIPLFANHFISLLNKKHLAKKSISKDAISFLQSYHFPGNVRELKNILENAFIQANDNMIHKKHLWIEPLKLKTPGFQPHTASTSPLKKAVHSFEKEFILHALEKKLWNVTSVASTIGLTREGLIKKMKRLNIIKP